MINAKTAVLGTCTTVGFAVALAGCQTDNYPVSWEGGMPLHAQPYQEWWSYAFVYYPGQQVYFEPYTETYFWFDGGLWEEGQDLPEHICLDSGRATVVKLQNKKPYLQHETVMAWHQNFYGPVPGSLDAYHGTPEAIAMSEERSAVRLASTIEEIEAMTEGLQTTPGIGEEPTGQGDDGSPVAGVAPVEGAIIGRPMISGAEGSSGSTAPDGTSHGEQ